MQMKAAIRHTYGLPEVLHIAELPVRMPQPNEVLIKVLAATVNRTDCAFLSGKPLLMRLITGWPKPNLKTTGSDFAGTVEAVGTKVNKFKPGDLIFGFNDSGLPTHAVYMTISAKTPMATIPPNISYQQAAASIEGAHYALNFLNKIKLQPGDKVLVNGATGAIGSALVQLLKYAGAIIIATSSTKNMELTKRLGADKVINYETDDFTRQRASYDYVFDAAGKSNFSACKPILKEGGIYISSELGKNCENIWLALTTALLGKKKVIFPVPLRIGRSIAIISELLGQGKFDPVIDRTYPLEEIQEAFRYVASGQKTGNVIIQMH
jgi:NADPH:quinone reductase-like Zn-dependent oxidoreductase